MNQKYLMELHKEIKRLLVENEENLKKGVWFQYQFNCLRISGLSFALHQYKVHEGVET